MSYPYGPHNPHEFDDPRQQQGNPEFPGHTYGSPSGMPDPTDYERMGRIGQQQYYADRQQADAYRRGLLDPRVMPPVMASPRPSAGIEEGTDAGMQSASPVEKLLRTVVAVQAESWETQVEILERLHPEFAPLGGDDQPVSYWFAIEALQRGLPTDTIVAIGHSASEYAWSFPGGAIIDENTSTNAYVLQSGHAVVSQQGPADATRTALGRPAFLRMAEMLGVSA